MNKGFTMVELLAAIIILSTIMIIAVPTYTNTAAAVKESSLKNKTDTINASMYKFAKKYLLDDVKPAGQNCSNSNNCCKEYDLYKFVLEYGIYASEERNEEGNVIIDPITNQKLNGIVKVKYNINTYDLDIEFIKDKTITTPSADCK